MDTNTIILTVLRSGTLATLVSGPIGLYNNHRIKSIEFRYDYKKFMLEKRKIAYDLIERFFAYHERGLGYPVDDEREPLKLKTKLAIIEQCFQFQDEINKHQIWISDKLQEELRSHFALLELQKQYYIYP